MQGALVLGGIGDSMELKIRDLYKTIGNDKILDGFELELKEGDVLALRGSNGSGKTTLLKIIAGLDKNYDGEISFDNNLTIGYVPQDIILFEDMNVRDNLRAFCNGSKAKENLNRLEGFAEVLGLSKLFKKKSGKLSGGQKRLVNFLIGLAGNPGLLLLDEVIVGMDEDTVKSIVKLLNSIKADKIIIITSHQEDFLKEVCNINGRLIGGKMELCDED